MTGNINIKKGNYATFDITTYDSEGDIFSLAGYSMYLKSYNSAGVEVISKTATIASPASGVGSFVLSSDDTDITVGEYSTTVFIDNGVDIVNTVSNFLIIIEPATSVSCTSVGLIEAELRTSTSFSELTSPKRSDVENWIDQTCDYLSSISGKKYSISPYIEYFNYSGEEQLYLKETPIYSVTTVEYDSSSLGEAENWVTLVSGTNYKIDQDKGVITLYPSKFSYALKDGVNRFRVSYEAGYSTVPVVIQMLATKMVANRVLESLINQNIDTRADGGSISVGDIRIVEPANYGVGSYKQLKADIKSLTDEVVGGSKGFRVYRYG